jgi:hypothetical protein
LTSDRTERERRELYPAWLLLAMTGMRRGEALAVRWGDVDFDAGTLAVRRSAVLIKAKGEGERLVVGAPKSGKSRVIDLDARTLAALRAHRAQRGALSLALARDDAYMLGRLDGGLRHPERLSREFTRQLASAARQLGEATLRRSGCTTCGTPTPRSICAPACTRRSSASAWGTPPSRSPWTSTSTRCRRCSGRPPRRWPPSSTAPDGREVSPEYHGPRRAGAWPTSPAGDLQQGRGDDVREGGVEPPRPKAPDPKSGVAAVTPLPRDR